MWHVPKHSWICALFIQLQCHWHNSDPKFDGRWKLRYSFDMLSDVHTKFYSASGHLTVGKDTVVFRERIIVKRCIAKEHNVFRKKFTHCVTWVGVCINGCPLEKGRTSATAEMTATKVTAHMWQENWRDMDRNCVLTIFCFQLIQ
jgi:hypothetical protein